MAGVRAIGRAAPTTANRSFGLLRALLKWGAREGHIAASLIAAEALPFQEHSRERVLREDELASIWAALVRLVGAILLEQNDEWAVQRARYMIAPLGDNALTSLSAEPT